MSNWGKRSGAPDAAADIWRWAVDSLVDHAFITWDASGTITSWNPGAERLLGYDRDEVVGLHVSMIFADEQPCAPLSGNSQGAEYRRSVTSKCWLVHRAGTRRYVNTTIVPLRDESAGGGQLLLGYEEPNAATVTDDAGSSRDTLLAQVREAGRKLAESNALLVTEIADRRQAEAGRIRLLRRLVMAQEEERRRIARDLHDDLGQGLTALRLTLEGLESRADGAAGSSQAIATALAMLRQIDQGLDFLAWELRPAALDELGLARVLDQYVREWSRHAGVEAMFHARNRENERFAPEVEASVYRIAQEALNNVAKHARARSVNVLLEQRGQNIVLVVEDDGVGCQALRSHERMIGLTGMRERAEAVGGTLEMEPTPGGGTTVLAHIPMSIPVGRAHEPSPDGRGSTAVVSTGSVSLVSYEPTGAVLTSLRARLQELQHAVAARDEFVATVAHELRNPVAPLMFQLRLAIEKSEQATAAGKVIQPEWVQSQLRRVEQRLHRLLETLDRLLDVSRLSTGRIELQPEEMNLAATVREIVSTFDAELAVARCKLVFDDRGNATGWWDRLRVEQICRNLLSNAIRFGAGRPIEVLVDADEDFATLQVRDHGVGIAFDQHARIFERFERGAEQRSGGFGIGLWVVKNICVAMGGTIAVESELGDGARFTVMLPRHKNGETAAGPEGM